MKILRSIVLTFVIMVCIFPICAQSQSSIGYGIVVDNTLSTMNVLDFEVSLAREIVGNTDKSSYISVFAFATDPVSKRAGLAQGVQCTTDRTSVNNQLDQLFAVTGQTKLIDGIWDASSLISDKRPDKCPGFDEKHLILITDGEDRASLRKPADLISELKSKGVKVSIIGLISGLSDDRGFTPKSARQSAREFLNLLAKETGGTVIYPKKDQTASNVVKTLLEGKTKK